MFWVDHEPRLMAALPLADGLDEGPMESRCDTPTRDCGASMRRPIRFSYALTISCVILARITLYKRDRVLDRAR